MSAVRRSSHLGCVYDRSVPSGGSPKRMTAHLQGIDATAADSCLMPRVGSGWLGSALICLAMPGIAWAQTDSAELREEDDEPNQHAILEPVGTESASERSQWLLEGAELVLKPRTYYLHRDYDVANTRAGWALGGGLEFRSGWWEDRVRFGATVSTSQKLYGPSDQDGTQLFKPGPESFSVFSEAYATVRLGGDHGVHIGRQAIDLPYMGKHDLRMIPNTFNAVTLGNKPGDGLAYMAGYVDSIKYKDSDEFTPMSVAAGADDTGKGLTFWGVRFRVPDQSVVGVIHQRTPDLFHTTFAKLEKRLKFTDATSLWADISYTGQSSIGDELIGDFRTHLISTRLEFVSGVNKFRVGASRTDEGGNIQKPYGNPANYLSVIINDFDRAGEDAFSLGYSRDLGQVGPGEASFFANVVWGNTPDSGPIASADNTEFDLTVDWRLNKGWSDKVWVRFRGAWVRYDSDYPGADDLFDFRIIVNYDFDLL